MIKMIIRTNRIKPLNRLIKYLNIDIDLIFFSKLFFIIYDTDVRTHIHFVIYEPYNGIYLEIYC